ncbi:hypothetical protein L0F63_004465 [Massospora cicadina]|nr:hypothetical protein L0F63_004465 [Massospora cicadina]
MDPQSYKSRVDTYNVLLSAPKGPHKTLSPSGELDLSVSTLDEERFSQDLIDIEFLKRLCLEGIPDEGGVRSTYKCTWLAHLSEQRRSYYSFVRDLISEPGIQVDTEQSSLAKSDPLSAGLYGAWDVYYKDTAMLEQIDIDIRRTLADVDFFQRQVPISPQHSSTSFDSVLQSDSPHTEPSLPWGKMSTRTRRGLFRRLKSKHDRLPIDFKVERSDSHSGSRTWPKSVWMPYEISDFNWEALERILFIYAKLNPGVGYVQGMNELIGTLYYVCANDTESWHGGRAHAEADAFYLFTAVMGLVRDQYVREFDRDQQSGVQATLAQLELRLQHAAPRLAADLQAKKIDPTFYAFRWITVLGTLEFPLPDVIRLWDGLFAYSPTRHPEPIRAMVMISVAMLNSIQALLLEGTFAENLHLLQHFPSADIPTLLAQAWDLDAQFQARLSEGFLPGVSNLGFQRCLNQLKSLIDHQRDKASHIAPKKETLFKSWTAAKRFLANTHHQPI